MTWSWIGDGEVIPCFATVAAISACRPKSLKVWVGSYATSVISTGFLFINCEGSKVGCLRPPPLRLLPRLNDRPPERLPLKRLPPERLPPGERRLRLNEDPGFASRLRTSRSLS